MRGSKRETEERREELRKKEKDAKRVIERERQK